MQHQTGVKRITLAAIAVAGIFSAAAYSSSSDSTAGPRVELLDKQGYEHLVAAKTGKVLVVNMWATWCEPCREEFPDLVRFDREMSPRGVELISLSLDLTADIESKVIPFLKEQEATFSAFVKKAGGDDEFINSIDRAWSGALPATFIYDTSGKLNRSILTTTSFEELVEAVEPLLKKD